MTIWLGRNWQWIDSKEPQAVIGVTFGIGLLDEEVEAAGTLSLVLAALRTELGRPVDLGEGVSFIPEVSVELGADTATLTLRGSPEGVSAAWRRLPKLFTPEIVTAATLPLRPDASPWPADLLRRTGRNAAALSWLQTTASDAHERAGTFLSRLAPAARQIPAVFFTTEESLLGLAFPIEKDGESPAPRTQWADGTRAWTATACATRPSAAVVIEGTSMLDDSLGLSPTSSVHVLFSVLVPRSASGLRAAELLCRQASALAANTIGDQEGMRLEVCGAGAAYTAVVLSQSAIRGPARHQLLREAGTSLGLVPDAWLDDALSDSIRPSVALPDPALPAASGLERERQLLGLAARQEVTVARLRQAVDSAVESLHLNFIPASAELDNAKQADSVGYEQDRQQVFKSRVGQIAHGRRVPTWDPSSPPSWIDSLIIGAGTIRIGGLQAGHGQRAKITEGVATASAVAILEDEAGTLVIVDEQLRTLTIQPVLFHHQKRLRMLLDSRLAGVPRLTFTSTVNMAKLQQHLRRSKRTKFWWIAVPAAVVGITIGANIIANSAEPAVTERLRMDQTATLHNGTTITVWGLGTQPGDRNTVPDQATVQVKFCAGADTQAKDHPPETQRRVSPENFRVFNEGQGFAESVDSDGQLPTVTLQEGECVTGELMFSASLLDKPHAAYTNAVGDDVVWYAYGETPKK